MKSYPKKNSFSTFSRFFRWFPKWYLPQSVLYKCIPIRSKPAFKLDKILLKNFWKKSKIFFCRREISFQSRIGAPKSQNAPFSVKSTFYVEFSCSAWNFDSGSKFHKKRYRGCKIQGCFLDAARKVVKLQNNYFFVKMLWKHMNFHKNNIFTSRKRQNPHKNETIWMPYSN